MRQGGFLLGTIILVQFMRPLFSDAQTVYKISPLIIEHTTTGRDIITRDITLSNPTERNVRLYASVHAISSNDDTTFLEFVPASMSDRSTSVTSWMEISRARLELPAQAELVVPLTIRINPNAAPGEYRAFVGFAPGANRDEAEARILEGNTPGTIVSIKIQDKRSALLKLTGYFADRFSFKADTAAVSFTLENAGDVAIKPAAEVILYDSRGVEIETLNINKIDQPILPGQKVQVTEALPYTGKIGRHKAFLSVRYGDQGATVYDTTYYYSIPWYYGWIFFGMLLLIGGLLLFTLFYGQVPSQRHHDGQLLPIMLNGTKKTRPTKEHDINLKKQTIKVD